MKMIFFVVCFLMLINVNASKVVMDADSGRVLYGEGIHERKLVASTTKIMTAIIAIENAHLYDSVIVGKEIYEVNGSMMYSSVGEIFTLEDMLYGLLLVSGNDAAMSIANTIGYDKFISEMNKKAKEIGMKNTTFENPHGLNDDTKNYSTAYDLAVLMKYANKNKEFVKITNTKKYKTKSSIREYIWYNKNDLLNYKYCTGGKIGYTRASGQVFVSSASKNNKNLIIASIDEGSKFELHKNLYEKYFDMYEKYKIIDEYTFSINDKRYKDYYMYISNDINLLVKKSEKDKIKVVAKINNELSGKIAGYLNVYIDDELILKEKIYYMNHKKEVNRIKSLLSFF